MTSYNIVVKQMAVILKCYPSDSAALGAHEENVFEGNGDFN
jgi:hypothetical protein